MSSQNSPQSVFPDLFPPREIRILGAGRFGRIAAERLNRRFPDAVLTIADDRAEKIEQVRQELGISGEVGDSLQLMVKRPLPEHVWIIPAVPLHLGFQWILRELKRTGTAEMVPVPGDADAQVPNPIRSSGTLYASFATFICPDHCSEPDEICTHTGRDRQGNLYDVFGSVRVAGFDVAVLRSWQLAPGVGGYPVRSLIGLLGRIRSGAEKCLVATSCRCHGVMNGLEWKSGCMAG